MKTQFKKNHFLVIKEAIDPKVANFVYNYFLMKKQVARTFFDTRYISPFTTEFGVWSDEQVPDTYSHYADTAMETLLLSVQPKMEKLTGLKLNPTYSYARIYKKGDILHRHKDRFLHYNDVNSKDADKNIFDGRPHLGLPSYFKGFKL